MDFQLFARWFRASSPYIRAHRGKRFVILLDQDCLEHANLNKMVRDLALIHVLGAKLILVIEPAERSSAQQSAEVLRDCINSLRERFERGLPTSRHRNQHIELACGDYVQPARAEFSSTETGYDPGRSHQLNVNLLEQDIESEALVLVAPWIEQTSSVVSVNDLIANLPLALNADKLIIFSDFANEQNEVNSDLSTEAFAQLVEDGEFEPRTERRLQSLLHACRQGLKRGHIVSSQTEGALLAELFTADGSGIQISNDDYLTIREADSSELDVVFELMQEDLEQDRVVPRTREALSDPSTKVFLAEHDNTPVGCVALYSNTGGMQEIGTLIAAPKHRDRNIGSRLLHRAESEARQRGASHAYVFSKHTRDWFSNHDYMPAELDCLPKDRQKNYDADRRSTLLIKELT